MTEKEEMKSNKPTIQEYHNQELVSKLIAATPSYLYAPPTGPHTFFFSEMLRSFVQKRKIEEMNPVKAKQMAKKIRKPNLYNSQVENDWKRPKTTNSPQPILHKPKTPELVREEQLDLRKSFSNENEDPKPNSPPADDNSEPTINVDKDDESPVPPLAPSSTSTAPLPPPLLPPWYHPHSPFYDPLHFFIDLRVSGHIYDRKKDYLHQALKSNNILLDSNTWNPSIIGKNRPGSAFKVPNSIQDSPINYNSAINLVTANNQNSIAAPDKSSLNFDYYDSKENKDKLPNNTNYVMQNLPNIYKKLYTKPDEDCLEHQDDRDSNHDKNSDEDVEVIFDLDVKLEQKK